MGNTATQTGGKPLIYDLATSRLSDADKERLFRIALQVLSGEVDTMIVRKNFKGAGLWIKGMKYTE